jgi:hypothetical protein
MDKRIQRGIEVESMKVMAESAQKNTATLEDVVARLERIEASLRESPRTGSPSQPKGGR